MDRSLSSEGLSLYKALDIPKTSTDSEIKKAYYKKALKCHPDKNPNDSAAEQFKVISKANTVLRNERKRNIYDKLGSQGLAIVDNAGIEVAEAYSKLDNWWVKSLFLFGCLATGCCFGCGCCCCCLCCCCGKCKPSDPEEDEQELQEQDRMDSSDTDNGKASTLNQESSNMTNNSTPIILQPPTSSNRNNTSPYNNNNSLPSYAMPFSPTESTKT